MSDIKSSYNNKIDYSELFASICFLSKPKKVIEIGILNGYSLESMAKNVSSDCQIDAYDIFDKFNGNSANQKQLCDYFAPYSNVTIQYGDFYQLVEKFEDNSVDIFHIDIANNGDVYKFVLNNYIKKLKPNGIILMEGGSDERDAVEWMDKYNKPKIKPVLEEFASKFNIKTIGNMPSITLITKN